MLGSAEVVHLVADRVVRPSASPGHPSGGRSPLVVDPVLAATSGAALADAGVVEAYVEALLPVASVVTPNHAEAAVLLGHDGNPGALALALTDLCPTVVLTGGPEPGAADSVCTDWLAHAGEVVPLTHPAVRTSNDHGTGCTFSAALAVGFARRYTEPITAAELRTAVRRAAHVTSSRLALSRTWDLGRGRGPIGHITSPHIVQHHLNPEVPR
jgi:hydroxymethylpyrimidine/phosphomethylpyrimidine kinase